MTKVTKAVTSGGMYAEGVVVENCCSGLYLRDFFFRYMYLHPAEFVIVERMRYSELFLKTQIVGE